MSEPLKDKRLEAAAQILAAMYTKETGYITDESLARNRKWVECEPKMSSMLLKAAIRETLAGELAQNWKDYFMAETKADMIIALETAKHLLARFKELNHE